MSGIPSTLPRELFRSSRAVALATAAAVIVAGLMVHRFWLREFSHLTGAARWIWVDDTLERVHPSAGLFVASLQLSAPPPGVEQV